MEDVSDAEVDEEDDRARTGRKRGLAYLVSLTAAITGHVQL